MGNSEIKSSIWDAITANDPETLISTLKKHPKYLNAPISEDNKTNAVTRAAYLDRPHILAALYSLGADLDQPAESSITGLMWAAGKGNLESVKFLLNFGADIHKTGPFGLTAADFSVLFGSYRTAFYLYTQGSRPTKDVEEFLRVKEQMQTPWIDFGGILMSLDKEIPPEVVPFFTLAPIYKEPVFEDPVRDPNETWGNWFNRVLEFERPPLVERRSLQVGGLPESENIARVKHDPDCVNVTVEISGNKSIDIS